MLNLKAIAGEFTVQGRHIDLSKLPVFTENSEKVTRIQFWRQPESGIANLYINETWEGDGGAVDTETASFLQTKTLEQLYQWVLKEMKLTKYSS